MVARREVVAARTAAEVRTAPIAARGIETNGVRSCDALFTCVGEEIFAEIFAEMKPQPPRSGKRPGVLSEGISRRVVISANPLGEYRLEDAGEARVHECHHVGEVDVRDRAQPATGRHEIRRDVGGGLVVLLDHGAGDGDGERGIATT